MVAKTIFGNRKRESKKAIKKKNKKTQNTLSSKKATKKRRKKGNGQEKRKHALDIESDQEKKKKTFFFSWSRRCFLSLFLTFFFSFYKFSPQVKALDLPAKLKTYRWRAHLIYVHCIQKRRHESGRSLLLFAKKIQRNHFLFVTLIMNRAVIFKSRKTIQLTFIRGQIRICLCIHSSRHAL